MNRKHNIWVRIIGILFIGIFIPHILMPKMGAFGNAPYYVQIIVSTIVAAFLWEGNLFIIDKLQEYFPWQKNSIKRAVIQFSISGIYSNIIIFIVIAILCFVLKMASFKWELVIYHLVISTVLVIMIGALYESNHFLEQWKETLRRADRLEKENIVSKYETLKNQVNPHFLFNSMNTLSGMIMDQDNDRAVDFINKLSAVYRYILQSRDKDIVDLETEMKVVEQYVFLLESRFEENIEISVDIKGHATNTVIPPLTIQMLVENAVKHNVVSSSNPLKIWILIKEDHLIVRNTLLLKQHEGESSTRTGLENIKNRYQILSKEEVVIQQDDNFFEVILPLLHIEESKKYESTDNRRRGACCKKVAKDD